MCIRLCTQYFSIDHSDDIDAAFDTSHSAGTCKNYKTTHPRHSLYVGLPVACDEIHCKA